MSGGTSSRSAIEGTEPGSRARTAERLEAEAAERRRRKRTVRKEAQRAIADAEQAGERATAARHRIAVLEAETASADDWAGLTPRVAHDGRVTRKRAPCGRVVGLAPVGSGNELTSGITETRERVCRKLPSEPRDDANSESRYVPVPIASAPRLLS